MGFRERKSYRKMMNLKKQISNVLKALMKKKNLNHSNQLLLKKPKRLELLLNDKLLRKRKNSKLKLTFKTTKVLQKKAPKVKQKHPNKNSNKQ